MGTDLLSIFKKADLKEVGKTTGNIISLALKSKDPPHNCAQTIHIIPATQISRKSAIQAHYLHTK